jgi:hypothetical protein
MAFIASEEALPLIYATTKAIGIVDICISIPIVAFLNFCQNHL